MFEYISETPYGMRKRVQFIYEEIEKRIKDIEDRKKVKILDIGCGTGELVTIPLGQLGVDILGIDIHLPSIKYAKRKNPLKNVYFKCTSIDELSDRQFDFVICSEVLEHLPEPIEMLKSIRKRMKHNGICFITIPNGYGPKEMEIRLCNFLETLGVITILRLLKHLAIRKNNERGTINARDSLKDSLNTEFPHVQFFSYRRFEELVERSGLSIIRYQNRRFLSGPFSDKLLSRSERLISWNVKIADKLPYFLVSSWMFVLKIKSKTNSQALVSGM